MAVNRCQNAILQGLNELKQLSGRFNANFTPNGLNSIYNLCFLFECRLHLVIKLSLF